MSMNLISESTNNARTSVIVSASQLVSALLGGLFALLVVVVLGESAEADGFLAAYSIYLLLIVFGLTLRVSLVPMLGSTSRPTEFERTAKLRVSEILPVAILLGGLLVALSPVLGDLLMHGASEDAKRAAERSIAILGLAAIGQIWAATISSVLGGAQRFVVSSLVYVASSALMLVASVVLMRQFGVIGAAIGVVVAAAVLVIMHVAYAGRLGFWAWPNPRALVRGESWRAIGTVSSVSISTMVLQLNLTVAIAFVSGTTGLVSGYVYAYLATVMVTGVTASTIGLVTLPGLMRALDDQGPEAVDHYLRETSAFGVFLYLPVALGFAFFGRPVLDAIFDNTLSIGTIDFLWDAARIFMVMGLIWSAFVPLATIALSLRRYSVLAISALMLIPVHLLLLVILSPSGPIWTVVAHVISGSILYVFIGFLLLRDRAPHAVWTVARSIAPCLLLSLVFVLPSVVIGVPSTLAGSLLAIVGYSVVYLAAGVFFLPRVGGRMLELLLARAPGESG